MMAHQEPNFEESGAMEGAQMTPVSSWKGPIWDVLAPCDGKLIQWFFDPNTTPLPKWVGEEENLCLIQPYDSPVNKRVTSPAAGMLLRIIAGVGEDVREGITPLCEIKVFGIQL
ncbi:MAG TPA: hypothetical protein ACFYD1_09485 [Candidatus Hypogeohydataceae bacterium YC38]|nr:hypothetical protein [Candidatus Brocadiales bacterium]